METLVITQQMKDQETGLCILNSLKAGSGFNYQTGVREFGDLKIVEGVSKGTANIFLTSIMVFDQHGSLIYDAEIRKLTNYSREVVRKNVLHGLIEMLREAAVRANKSFDELQAYQAIDEKLKTAYFSQSYEAVLRWAKEVGVELT